MKALFAHDNRFVRQGDDFYSSNQFESELWQGYLRHFDDLAVVARLGTRADLGFASLAKSSCPKVSFVAFPDLSNLKQLLTPAREQSLLALAGLVRECDVVIARLPSEIGLLAVEAGRLERKTTCIEVAGCIADSLRHNGSWQARLYSPIAYRRMRAAVRAADHVSYVTNAFLQSRYPTLARNVLAASDVMLDPPAPDALERRLERIASLKSGRLRLGLIGRLHDRTKGVQNLLIALSAVRRSFPQLELRILGEGNLLAWAREAAELGVGDLVHFDGTLSRDRVLGWLDDIDVYIQPSLQEGLPRALIEAMSRACPAIGSTAGGIPELLAVEDLVPSGDSAELAHMLLERVGNLAWMAASAERNWARAGNFSSAVLEPPRQRFWEQVKLAVRSQVD